MHCALQIPWGRLRGGPLIIELHDVTLCATARDGTDWEEGPALRRAQAAKQAQLAAAELAKLSKRMTNDDEEQEAPALHWSIVDYATSFLLNRLQFSINNVHVYFKVGVI